MALRRVVGTMIRLFVGIVFFVCFRTLSVVSIGLLVMGMGFAWLG